MGGLRKAASKVHRWVGKSTDPAAYYWSKSKGKDSPWERSSDDVEEFTGKYIWGGPIEPENPNPELPPVQAMPDQDDESLEKSRKRNQSRRRASSGRSSTILSDGQGLGG